MAHHRNRAGIDNHVPAQPVRLAPDIEMADPLEALLHHLQGSGTRMAGDAGIARFASWRLDAICRAARTRAEDCLLNAQSLSRLLAQLLVLRDAPIRDEDLAGAAGHVSRLMEEHRRWLQLAEHASVYRQQPALAAEVARRWLGGAQSLNEWPGQDAAVEAAPSASP